MKKDILQQIQGLKEDFNNLLETKVDTWVDAAQKRIDDNPQMGVTSRGKEELERLKLIASLPKDGRQANEVKAEARMNAAVAARKAIDAMLKGDEKEKAKQDEIEYKNALIGTDNKGFCFSKYKAPKKMNDNNSYNELLTRIQNLKESFMNLIEVEGLGQPASDVPPSTNKIKRDIKTKNGKAELVSVEDELFPYDGNKQEQYRQKVIDTINGMIQGTATLDDLMNIVRTKKGIKSVKEALSEGRKPGESKEDFKHRLHGELVRAIDDKANKAKQDLIAGKKGAYDKYKKEHDKLDKLDDIEPVANAYANETFDKNEEREYNNCKALQLWEQVINELEDGAINRAIDNTRDKIAFARIIQAIPGSKEFKDAIEDAIAKKNHQIEVVQSKKEDRVISRAKEDEAKKKKRK